jgi:hypothetical protein
VEKVSLRIDGRKECVGSTYEELVADVALGIARKSASKSMAEVADAHELYGLVSVR